MSTSPVTCLPNCNASTQQHTDGHPMRRLSVTWWQRDVVTAWRGNSVTCHVAVRRNVTGQPQSTRVFYTSGSSTRRGPLHGGPSNRRITTINMNGFARQQTRQNGHATHIKSSIAVLYSSVCTHRTEGLHSIVTRKFTLVGHAGRLITKHHNRL